VSHLNRKTNKQTPSAIAKGRHCSDRAEKECGVCPLYTVIVTYMKKFMQIGWELTKMDENVHFGTPNSLGLHIRLKLKALHYTFSSWTSFASAKRWQNRLFQPLYRRTTTVTRHSVAVCQIKFAVDRVTKFGTIAVAPIFVTTSFRNSNNREQN